jgi:hypothetical protein
LGNTALTQQKHALAVIGRDGHEIEEGGRAKVKQYHGVRLSVRSDIMLLKLPADGFGNFGSLRLDS